MFLGPLVMPVSIERHATTFIQIQQSICQASIIQVINPNFILDSEQLLLLRNYFDSSVCRIITQLDFSQNVLYLLWTLHSRISEF